MTEPSVIRFGSVFSGIGGFDLGLERAGLECHWQIEIDRLCSSVLARHWPFHHRYEDVKEVESAGLQPIELLTGGFPCQDVSVAGRRAGLGAPRSGLFYEFARLIDEIAPRWVLVENVPGLLHSNGGRDMGAVLGTLAELGYGYTYRVLDSRYFGVAQRRRRVFIVGHSGGYCPPEVLLESEGLPGDNRTSSEAGPDIAAGTLSRSLSRVGGGDDPGANKGAAIVTHPLVAEHDSSEDGTGRGTPIVMGDMDGPAETLDASYYKGAGNVWGKERQMVYTFDEAQLTHPENRSNPQPGDPAPTLPASRYGHTIADPITTREGKTYTHEGNVFRLRNVVNGPRRLTPRECERLQGFPDDWTLMGADGKQMSDAARYRMLGNAVTVNVAEWIGHRLKEATKC